MTATEPPRTDHVGADDAPGFFGKLPTLGDFVSRRLSRQFLEPWDQWLQQVLAESRARLGDAWLGTFLVSPLWRFVLSPGIAGPGAWAGVMMPSVDRVGRYFPLTLARHVPANSDCFRLLCADAWFGELERLALSTLQDDFQLQDFDTGLMALPPPPLTLRTLAGNDAGRPDAWQLDAGAEALPLAASRLLLRALDDAFLAYSLWWSAGSEQVDASLLSCQGLPAPDAYTAMLGGDWGAGGWTRLGAV